MKQKLKTQKKDDGVQTEEWRERGMSERLMMHIYLRSLDRFLFSGAPGVLHTQRQADFTCKQTYSNVCKVGDICLKEADEVHLDVKSKTHNVFFSPLTTFLHVLLSVWSLFRFAPSVSLHPWERIRCLLSGHVSRAVGHPVRGCAQHDRAARTRPSG